MCTTIIKIIASVLATLFTILNIPVDIPGFSGQVTMPL